MKKFILILILCANYFVGWAIEPDPRILWVADSSIKYIDGFAVHPNGNIFAYRGAKIFEIDGTNGKLLRELPKFTQSDEIASIDISNDGKYLAISLNEVIVIDLTDLSSKTLGHGNPVKFTSDSKYAVFGPQSPAQHFQGHDSTLVFANLENGERKFLKNDEGIVSFAFSPDGRYFATGGIGKNINDKYYTTLKLWDAQSLKLIKELALYNDSYKQIAKIEFSPGSKMIAFFGDMGLPIYSTQNYIKIKEYTNSNLGVEISRFTFLDEEFIGIQSNKTSIIKLLDDKKIDLIEFPYRGFLMESSINKKILYAGTGYPIQSGSLIAWDLKIALSNNTESQFNSEFKSEYQNGILLLSGINSSNNSVNLEIFDINGKLIRQLSVESNGNELRIPIVLTKGTYLLNLTVGNKQYSSKFMVVE